MRCSRALAGLLSAVLLMGSITPAAGAASKKKDIWELKTDARYHEKYMDGGTSGAFEPNRSVTRAEAAQMVYNLLEEQPEGYLNFYDVPITAWYGRAASALVSAQIIEYDPSGFFRPGEALTRAECASILAHFVPASGEDPSFFDVPKSHPAYDAIAAVTDYGLFTGDQYGRFNPDAPLSRAEAAVVFNRLLGRVPDRAAAAVSAQVRRFSDVPVNLWCYADVAEATTSHECETDGGEEIWTKIDAVQLPLTDRGGVDVIEYSADELSSRNDTYTAVPVQDPVPVSAPPVAGGSVPLSDGFHSLGGWLYYVRNGEYVRAESVNGFQFDINGHYTTGNPDLDQKLTDIVRAQTNDSMTRDQKLRALYNYVRDNFTYIKRDLVTKGQTGWEAKYALAFLNDGKGNCFSFAAAFCLLARELGCDAKVIVGTLGSSYQPHGWVEIPLDGTTYVFDTELEMIDRVKGRKHQDMFKFQYGGTTYTYHK